jgi:hypothetical protein
MAGLITSLQLLNTDNSGCLSTLSTNSDLSQPTYRITRQQILRLFVGSTLGIDINFKVDLYTTQLSPGLQTSSCTGHHLRVSPMMK